MLRFFFGYNLIFIRSHFRYFIDMLFDFCFCYVIITLLVSVVFLMVFFYYCCSAVLFTFQVTSVLLFGFVFPFRFRYVYCIWSRFFCQWCVSVKYSLCYLFVSVTFLIRYYSTFVWLRFCYDFKSCFYYN